MAPRKASKKTPAKAQPLLSNESEGDREFVDAPADDEDDSSINVPSASIMRSGKGNEADDDESPEVKAAKPNLPAKEKPRFRNAETNFAPGRMLRELKAGNFVDRVQKRERQAT